MNADRISWGGGREGGPTEAGIEFTGPAGISCPASASDLAVRAAAWFGKD
ncbi:hypothetical protein [Amycolatopsis suaedae]|nr:hypothetical protein [Amycolatopsis suaedae]